MNQIITFVLGAVLGVIAMYFWSKNSEKKKKETLIEMQAREKKANKESILELLQTQGAMTNNHVEMMLGISDATATRYLEELEKEGFVRQVGGTGSGVYYEKI